ASTATAAALTLATAAGTAGAARTTLAAGTPLRTRARLAAAALLGADAHHRRTEGVDVAVGVDAVDAVAVGAAAVFVMHAVAALLALRTLALGLTLAGAALLLDAEGGHEVAHV